jgi:hypothetical protein
MRSVLLRTALVSLLSIFLVLSLAMTGCGDDDDDNDDTSGTGGSAGSEAGTGGEEAGSGGEAGGEPGATEEQKKEACDCYTAFYEDTGGSLAADCAANVTDACVTCVAEISAGKSCDALAEADLLQCAAECSPALTGPADSATCLSLILGAYPDAPQEDATCMCDNCLFEFAPCIINMACSEIVWCGVEAGCEGFACYGTPPDNPGPCSDVINKSMTEDEAVVEKALAVDECAIKFECRSTTGE